MSVFAELKRRNVIRVAVAYAAVAWLIIQVVETLFPVFGLENAAIRTVAILLFIGFIPVVISAWAFELTSDGLKRDSEVDRDSPISGKMTKRLDRVIMIFLALALAYFAYDKFQPDVALDAYGEKSIAVMPFADMSRAGDQAYFSDGIAEELLNLLAKHTDLRVISRTSSFALRDDGLSAPELAEKLNVGYVLEGSLRKDGDKIRITAQLIEAKTDAHMWSETFDRTLDDIFVVQDQIAARVVRELRIRLAGAVPAISVTHKTAYELYLQGLSLLSNRENMQQMQQAVSLFEQVIAIDPDFAPAHGSLAMALVWGDWISSDTSKIEDAISRTLALDEGNSDALAALGLLRDEQGLKAEARDAFERAIARTPSHAVALRWLGRSHNVDDPAQYYALIRKARNADPLDPTISFQMSMSALALGRINEAFAAAKELQLRSGGYGNSLAGDIHSSTGGLDLALQSYFYVYRDPAENAGPVANIPRMLLSLNEVELADAWVQAFRRMGPDSRFQTYLDGNLAKYRGQFEQALRLFAEKENETGLPTGAIDLGFANVTMQGDFGVARKAFERGLTAPGLDAPQFDPALWPWFMHYAVALQRTDSTEHAEELIAEILKLLNEQAANGVVNGPFENLQQSIARLNAMSGNTESALAALRLASGQGGLTCIFCLRNDPHFDNLRDVEEFSTLITAAEARIEVQRQRLTDAGLLLTPAELSQLEEYTFDPFQD